MDINTYNKYNFDNLKLQQPKKIEDVYVSNVIVNNTLSDISEENGTTENGKAMNVVVQTSKLKLSKVSKKLGLVLTEQMENLFNDFDNKIISLISENSEDFFQDKLNIEESEEIYKHSFKQSRKESKILLNLNKNLTIYNKNKDNLEYDSLNVNDTVICLLKCKKIIFYKNYCEPIWEVFQIKFKEQELIARTYLFIEDINDTYNDNLENDDIENDNIKKIKIKTEA